MKLFKFFILICAAAVFTAALGGCDKRPKQEREAEKRAEAALPKVSPPSQVKTDNAVIHAGTCSADSDCVAVFPSCCGEANPPYYINKLYKEDFVADYRKINKEDPCPKDLMCPISYFGKAIFTRCQNNICIEAMPLAQTMKGPVAPAQLKEDAARREAIKIIARNRAALAAKEHNFKVPTAEGAAIADTSKVSVKAVKASAFAVKKPTAKANNTQAETTAVKKAATAAKAQTAAAKTAEKTNK